MKWINVKDALPTNDQQYVLFVQWRKMSSTDDKYPPCIIICYSGLFKDEQIWIKDQLKDGYTHWMHLGKCPNQESHK